MLKLPKARALSCHFTALRVIAIMVGMIGCGGAIAPDATNGDESGGSRANVGCPSTNDLRSGAAVGTACASEGTYCADLSCDPCERACAAVSCSHGQWAPAVDTALCTSDTSDASVTIAQDAGTDATTCTQVDTTSFDQSCMQDEDCVAVPEGNVCNTGSCLCAAGAVNVGAQDSYQAYIKQALASEMSTKAACSCPFFGNAKCIQGTCKVCGGASPACPDAG